MTEVYRSEVLLADCQSTFSPQLRRATASMKMSIYLMEEFFKKQKDLFDEETPLIFCSRHGEIEPTIEFLKNYAEKALARPFLFQNSLHHSTLGFVSQNLQLLGPSYTLCSEDNPLGEAQCLAESLIEGGAPSVAILCVDHMPQFMKEVLGKEEYSKAQLMVLKGGGVD